MAGANCFITATPMLVGTYDRQKPKDIDELGMVVERLRAPSRRAQGGTEPEV
jgi:hypothetical protein